MDPLPRGTRRGRGGKLVEVLDHTLRIGDAEVSDKIIAAYQERGLTPPEHLEAPPQIDPRFLVYWGEALEKVPTVGERSLQDRGVQLQLSIDLP